MGESLRQRWKPLRPVACGHSLRQAEAPSASLSLSNLERGADVGHDGRIGLVGKNAWLGIVIDVATNLVGAADHGRHGCGRRRGNRGNGRDGR